MWLIFICHIYLHNFVTHTIFSFHSSNTASSTATLMFFLRHTFCSWHTHVIQRWTYWHDSNNHSKNMHTLLKVLSTGSDLYYRYIIRGTTPGRVSIGGNDITMTPGSPRTKTDHNWAKQCCNLSIQQDLFAFVMHQLHMGPFLYSLTFNNSRNTDLIQIRAPMHNSLYLLQYNQRVWTGHTTIYTHNL